MKRTVMAVIISATMYAATAVATTSCTWMEDPLKTKEEKQEGPDIPSDGVLRVGELIAGSFAGDTVWVKGFIVGGLREDGSIDFPCEGEVVGTAVVLADDAGCVDPDSCLVLRLTKNVHKEALGLDKEAVRAATLHHGLYVRGKATTYKKYPALTNLSDYKLE